MSEFDDFFNQVNPDDNEGLPRIPSNALTQPMESVLPFEIVYPKTIQYAGAFAIDNATKSLAVNMRAMISGEDFDPSSLSNRLPAMRVATIHEGEFVDGFVVDIRDTSAVVNLSTEDVDDINSRSAYSDHLKDRLYRPALAVVYETEEGFPAYNGDVRFLEFGKRLLITTNIRRRDRAGRLGGTPSGSYAIFDADYDLGQRQQDLTANTQDEVPAAWWKRIFKP